MPSLQLLLTMAGFAGMGLAAIYAVIAVISVLVWRVRRGPVIAGSLRPVTILKPLCGAEPGLHQHLRSFCLQEYPQFQIVFGVREAGDPACAVVARLRNEFPSIPMELVIDPKLHGGNLKISNLINMLPRARHDVFAIADSDAFVGSDYLRAVTAPLVDDGIGLVTCLYRGAPTPLVWSRLGAMYINEWYLPSVLVAWLFGHEGYVSGQTVCLRRDTLESIGGLTVLVNHLADDHRLGQLVRQTGKRIVLSPYVVQGEHHELNFDLLVHHEMRWLRTLHVLRPVSFRFIFITFGMPLAALGMLAAAPASLHSAAAWALFGTTAAARLVLHFVHRLRGDPSPMRDLWLVPIRDVLMCWVWCRSFFGAHFTWRGSKFVVGADGVMRPLS